MSGHTDASDGGPYAKLVLLLVRVSTVTVTALMEPKPLGSVHTILVWFTEMETQTLAPTLALPEVPTATATQQRAEREHICGSWKEN